MNRLLAGNLSRLRKNILFWLALVCAMVNPIYVVINNWYYKGLWDLPLYAEGPFFSIGTDYFFIIALAVVISLFIGTEYGYHTIRNKLISGYSRLSVYLANLTVSIIIAVAMYLTGTISACIGIPLLDGFVLPFGKTNDTNVRCGHIHLCYGYNYLHDFNNNRQQSDWGDCIAAYCNWITISSICFVV